MTYRKFPSADITTSVLGMGCMRLPTAQDGTIDEPEALRLVRAAIDGGITYVDTAYGYHGGKSEDLVGKALQGGYRQRVTLATKLPVWLVKEYGDMERLLDEQLERLQCDRVDFYLLHALSRESYDRVRALDVRAFLDEMVKKGKIRYPAFSFHDDQAAFEYILGDYDWKMAQVQMNVLDEFNQAPLATVRAHAKDVGFVVMEPLRGGALARPAPKEVREILDRAPTKRSPIEWAFRWLYDEPAFITILSGMSNMEQLIQNLSIFEDAQAGCMTRAEREMMTQVRKAYEARIRVGCTGCEYCLPCPAGVAIPGVFRALDNALMFDTLGEFERRYAKMRDEKKAGDQCVRCGLCEEKCPQQIQIRDMLAAIEEEYKPCG